MTESVPTFRLNRLASVIRSTLHGPWGYGCVAAAACLPGVTLAGPAGEQVVAGAAAVSRPDALTTSIRQTSDKTIINWQSFSIGGNEYVQFVQPNTTSIALNRVVGGDPSEILGQLSANGRVFLVNPRGVYFGPGAQVDVNGLVASVLDIKNEDFMAGNYVFARTADNPDGAGVVNAGTIRTQDGGFVVLAGGKVDNSGVIQSRLGSVALASGNRMTLTVGDTGLVGVSVDEAAVDSAAGVHNAGQILADGGRVLLTAKAAAGLLTTAVNNDGLVQAHSIQEHGGVITLSAAGGDVENHGTLDASGAGGVAGGEVHVTGDRNITLAPGSVIRADGSGDANGGTVRVVADGKLAVKKDSLISAMAGSAVGNGGFIELSGHGSLGIRGMVALGKGGTLLLDPSILTIVGGGNTSGYGSGFGELFIEGQLNSGVNVSLVASDEIKASGTFTGVGIDATSGSGHLLMYVTNGTPTGGINLPGFGIHTRGSVTLGASTDGFLENNGRIAIGNVTSEQGNITIRTNTGNITAGTLTQNGGGGVFVQTMSGNITVAGITTHALLNSATRAGVLIDATGDVDITNGIQTGRIAAVNGGSGSLSGVGIEVQSRSGHVNIGNGITVTGSLNRVTGHVEAIGMSYGGRVDAGIKLLAATGITVGAGGIHVSGYIEAGSAAGVGIKLKTTGGDITVNGDVNVTGGISGNAVGSNGAGIAVHAVSGNVTVAGLAATKIAVVSGGGGSNVGIKLEGNAIQVNGVVGAGGSTGSLGGHVFIRAANSVMTGVGGRIDGHIQVDGVEGAPGPIDVSIATRSPAIQFGVGSASSFGSAKLMNVDVDNTAYSGAATATFNNRTDFSPLVYGAVDLKFGGDVSISAIDAASLEVHSHGSIDIGSATVGSGALPGVGDVVLLDMMQQAGLPLPNSPSANALFKADGNVSVGNLTLTDSYPYIAFVLNGQLTLGNLNMSGNQILVQFAANDPNLTLGVENAAATLQNVNFDNTDHFSKFPGTTIAVGLGLAGTEQLQQQGDIIIGANGPINLGDKNFICLTVGQCIGLDKIITTGRTLSLSSLLNAFNVPLPNEFNNENDKDKDLYGGGEGEGGEGGGEPLVSQNTGSEKMCQ